MFKNMLQHIITEKNEKHAQRNERERERERKKKQHAEKNLDTIPTHPINSQGQNNFGKN